MALYKTYEKGIEVTGKVVLSVLEGMEYFKDLAINILKANGIKELKPNKWYSQQAWLDSFKQISERLGNATLKQIGKKVPDNVTWPPDIDSVDKALSSIDIAYHMNHRKDNIPLFNPDTNKMREGIGHYTYEKIGERSAKVICDNPYPDAFDHGIIESVAKKFSRSNDVIQVKQDLSKGSRTSGSNVSTFIITW